MNFAHYKSLQGTYSEVTKTKKAAHSVVLESGGMNVNISTMKTYRYKKGHSKYYDL